MNRIVFAFQNYLIENVSLFIAGVSVYYDVEIEFVGCDFD